MICDICLIERAELWGFSVAGFYEPLMNVHHHASEWGVCDDCKPLIEAQDASAITARVSSQGRVSMLLVPFYVLLLRNITGPIVRFHDQTTPLYGGGLRQ